MNNTHEDKVATRELVDICKKYLRDNFHKFSPTNQIKISLALITKAMPTQLESDTIKGDTKVVIIKETQSGNKDSEGRLSRQISIIAE